MTLFDQEQVITASDDNIVTLTTHRIRSSNSYGWGHERTISMMLEKVSSIQTTYNSYPLLLVLAVVFGVAAFFLGNQQHGSNDLVILLIVTGVLVAAYFATRRHICVITSDGGAKIIFQTSNMKRESLLAFMDKVEAAQNKRLLQIFDSKRS